MSIHREIIRLAWPAIATNITTPLLSLADVVIAGHLDGGLSVGAVAVGGTVFNILYWMFAFLRMGTSGLTAQAYGCGDKDVQFKVLFRGLIIALAGGLFVFALAQIAGFKAISLVDGSGAVQSHAWLYFRVAVFGAPGVLITFVVSGWLLGMQRSQAVMWIALMTNILNVILSVAFVFAFNMGIEGIALGTAVSQLFGAIIGLLVVRMTLRRESISRNVKNWFKGIWVGSEWKSLFAINRDIFLRTMCLAAVTLWFTHAGSILGTNVLAANSLLLQLFLVFSYFMDGFAFGGEALAGKYYGAGDFSQLKCTIKALFKWGIYTSLIFTVLYFFAADLFISWLTEDNKVIAEGLNYKVWIVTVPLMGFSAFTWDGIMIGLTRTRYLLISMVVAMGVFFGVYAFGRWLNTDTRNLNHILWLAFVLYLGVRGIVSTLLYRKFKRSLIT